MRVLEDREGREGVEGVAFRWPERLSAADRTGIARLVSTVSETTTILGYPGRLTPVQLTGLVTRLSDDIAAGSTHLLLGEPTGRAAAGAGPVGMVVLRRDAQPNCAHVGELSKGMIEPRWRGRGILAPALAEIARRARALGVELLRLDVRAGTAAERLWRAYGFTEYGRLADYAREGGGSFAGVYLVQRVDDLADRLGRAVLG